MDELEFRKRVYANPKEVDQETLAAAQADPALQKILDETRQLDTAVTTTVNGIAVPEGLAERLLALPTGAQAGGVEASKPASNNRFQYYALAASLIFMVGIGTLITLGGGPSTTEMAFGNEVIQHLYHEVNEIDAIRSGVSSATVATPTVVQVMAEADTHLNNAEILQTTPVHFANICDILPAYQSAHLIVQGKQGAVNVIVINNSPVTAEFTIRDDRFSGVIIPMGEGNLILIGEKEENLDDYKSMFAQNVEWVI